MIIPFQTSGCKSPLFLIHGSDGNADMFRGLVRHLDTDQPVYGIAQPAIQMGPAIIRLEDIAESYIREIQSQRIDGPYSFLGYSFGGLVALEMANRLNKSGQSVAFLGMLDTWLPIRLSAASSAETRRIKLMRTAHNLSRHIISLLFGPKRGRWFRETIVSRVLVRVYAAITRRKLDIPRWLRNSNDLNIFAASRYEPQTYSGRIVLIRAKDEFRDERWDLDLGWGQVATAGVEVRQLPGTHRELVDANPKMVADMIASYLSLA